MTKIDMSKIVKKYDKYLKRKDDKGEVPMSPEAWLWHNIDTFNLEDIAKEK